MLLRHQVAFVNVHIHSQEKMIAFAYARDSNEAMNSMNLCNNLQVQHPENLVHLLPKKENEN